MLTPLCSQRQSGDDELGPTLCCWQQPRPRCWRWNRLGGSFRPRSPELPPTSPRVPRCPGPRHPTIVLFGPCGLRFASRRRALRRDSCLSQFTVRFAARAYWLAAPMVTSIKMQEPLLFASCWILCRPGGPETSSRSRGRKQRQYAPKPATLRITQPKCAHP